MSDLSFDEIRAAEAAIDARTDQEWRAAAGRTSAEGRDAVKEATVGESFEHQ